MVERVRAARAGVEQHPQEAPVVLAPQRTSWNMTAWCRPFRVEEALQHLHRHDVALIGLGGARDGVAVRLRTTRRVEQALGEIATAAAAG